jgi:hypothetical protein
MSKDIRKMIDKVKNFGEFNSNNDRELWIKLNAERLILFDKNCYDEKTGKPYSNALNPRTMEQALEIVVLLTNTSIYLVSHHTLIVFLILLDYEGLKSIADKKHKEWCDKFNSL